MPRRITIEPHLSLDDLGPFLIQGPEDEPINPDDFFYSYDDWIQKNYEEDELSFGYEGGLHT